MSPDQQDPPKEATKALEESSTSDRNPTPSSFTAVNGRGSPPKPISGVASPANAPVQQPSPSPKEADTSRVNGIKVPPTQSAAASLTTSPSIVESLTSVARNETPASPHTAANSPPPRKRSYPEDFERTEREAKRPALPDTQESPNANGAQNVPRVYSPLQDSAAARKMDQQRQKPLSSEYDPLAQPPQNYYSRQDDSDQQMSDPMPRDSEEANDRGHFATSEGDEPQRHPFPGDYSRTSGVQVDADRKRRKRVFSNRTKTGCMTCRKRKKKCDELHPECECYPFRRTWHGKRTSQH